MLLPGFITASKVEAHHEYSLSRVRLTTKAYGVRVLQQKEISALQGIACKIQQVTSQVTRATTVRKVHCKAKEKKTEAQKRPFFPVCLVCVALLPFDWYEPTSPTTCLVKLLQAETFIKGFIRRKKEECSFLKNFLVLATFFCRVLSKQIDPLQSFNVQ